jgi:uncharacterized protein (UPF0333 family)
MSVTFLVFVLIGVVCMGLVASYLARSASSKKKAMQITALEKKAKRLKINTLRQLQREIHQSV